MHNILKNFYFYDDILKVEPFGNGHINSTFLVITKENKYIIQKINTNVFKKPKEVMENIELVTDHIKKVASLGDCIDPKRASLEIIETNSKSSYVVRDNSYWRCYKYILGATTYDIIKEPGMFYEVGQAIGLFQKQLQNIPIKKLHITIPNFHNTPVRFKKFEDVVTRDEYGRGLEIFNEIKFVFDRQKIMSKITDLLDSGEIPLRVTHNDTKLDNVMIDERTQKAICVIDLDTVMPGSVLFDFGDAIRIGASTALEDEQDLSKVNLDINLFEQFTRGFLEKTHTFLNQKEKEYLVESARIITLECGMRFLTDYLENDIYFKVKYPEHNLIRARTQFKLVEEIEKNYGKLQNIVTNILASLTVKKVEELRTEEYGEKELVLN